MHARLVIAAACLAVVAIGCPRWDINGLVVQREEDDVSREEAIVGAVATLKCGLPPVIEPDGGVVEEPFGIGGPRDRDALTTDGGDDAGPSDAGVTDAGEFVITDAGQPNTGTEIATTGLTGTFRLSNPSETGPHQNCEVIVTAEGFVTRIYSMDKVCAHYEVYDGLLRCRRGFLLAELIAAH